MENHTSVSIRSVPARRVVVTGMGAVSPLGSGVAASFERLKVFENCVAALPELAEFKGTQDQKLELLENYYAVLEEIYNRQHAVEELHAERTREIWDAAFEHFDAWTNSLDSVLGAIGNVMQAEIDSGKLTEKEAKKKERTLKALEKVQLAVAVANIAANTAAGIMDVWRGYAAELPVNAATAAATGPLTAPAVKAALDGKSLATAIIRTTTIGAQGTAQLAAAIGGYISKSMASASAGGEETG